MTIELRRLYRFEAAHFLPRVPLGHKCARVHGHSYRVEVHLKGPIHPETGWLLDFSVIDEKWKPLFDLFDHQTLNDVPGLENSTCENLAVYIFNKMKKDVQWLSAVTVWETSDACCTYSGE